MQEDFGEYTVRATNDFGETTTTAIVTVVFEPPQFTKPLSDTPVTLMDTVTLEVEFSGIPQPDTKWLITGVELTESDKYHIARTEQTSQLQITNVSMDDTEMSYTCLAQNPVGEATTTARLLPQGLFQFAACICLAYWQCMVYSVYGPFLDTLSSITSIQQSKLLQDIAVY